MTGETVEQKVEKMMSPDNLRVDVKNDDGRWVNESKVK